MARRGGQVGEQGSGPPRLVLAGGGHAHLGVLAAWIARPVPGVETVLVTPEPFTVYSGMVPGWMAGFYGDDAARIDLRPLADRAGVALILDSVSGLDAEARRISLASGGTLTYDLLSLATGGEADVARLVGLGHRLQPVRPMSAFVEAWPAILTKAARSSRFDLVIVGGGAAGFEIGCAADEALRRSCRDMRITIVSDSDDILPGHATAVRRLAHAELVRRGIKVVLGEAVGEGDGVRLADGRRLPADHVIAATGSRGPHWAAQSGMAIDRHGAFAIDAHLRSLSHDAIFCAGDASGRVDQSVARSGVHAVKSGPVLAANLRAVLTGGRLTTYRPRRWTLYLLSLAERRAILSFGPIVMAGRWVWWLKDRIDRQFVAAQARRGQAAVREDGR